MKLAIRWFLPLMVALTMGPSQPAVGSDTVRIGVALPIRGGTGNAKQLREGAEQAVREINQGGGVGGRRFELIMAEPPPHVDAYMAGERAVADAGREQARRLERYAPIAVIGHDLPAAAAAAAEVYEHKGTLFFATHETDQTIRSDQDSITFQMSVPTRFTYEALARYARTQGWCRLVLYSERTPLGQEHALFFKLYARAMGLSVVGETSFDRQEKDFVPVMVGMQSRPDLDRRSVDALAFIGMPRAAGAFLRDAARLRVGQRVLMPWFSTNPETLEYARTAIAQAVLQQVFSPANPSPDMLAFRSRFVETFGMEPGRDALIAYDSIRLLAYAIEQSKSHDPRVLAHTLRALRFSGPYQGLTGAVSFDLKGRRVGLSIDVGEVNSTRSNSVEIQEILHGRTRPAMAVDVLTTYQDTERTLESLRQMPSPVCRPRQSQ